MPQRKQEEPQRKVSKVSRVSKGSKGSKGSKLRKGGQVGKAGGAKANGAAAESAAKRAPAPKGTANQPNGRLVEVRRSRIHGRGVFAVATIPKGTRIIEYKGKRISYAHACELYPDEDGKPTHTFLFELDPKTVIDAAQGGNAARWINHSCKPNCEAVDEEGRIFIESTRTIRPGEELGYDYNITLEERHTPREKARWPCLCGARNCRGTLLGKKR